MEQKNNQKDRNPLGMIRHGENGPYILPPQLCSIFRKDFLSRANRIVTTYAVITAYAGQGEKSITATNLDEKTPIKIKLDHRVFRTNYKKDIFECRLSANKYDFFNGLREF